MMLDASGLTLRKCNARLRDLIGSDGEVEAVNLSHLNGVGAGFKRGRVTVQGDVGDYLGILNEGCEFDIHGNAGRFLGDGMTGGVIRVRGNAGVGAGEYCYGGKIIIEGSAGDFVSTMNKGATIIVGGDVGSDAGTYMVAGDVIIVGSAGDRLGNYIIRGTIYLGGDHGDLGNNTRVEKLRSTDIDKIGALMKEMDCSVSLRSFRKIVPLSDKPFYKKKGGSP